MNSDPASMSHEMGSASAADAANAALRFLRVLRYRKIYVITAVVVAGLLGVLYYSTATPIYEANAQLLVTQTGSDVWSTSMSPDGGRQALIPTYERLFTSAVVLEGAIERLRTMPARVGVDFRSHPRTAWPGILRRNLTARSVRGTNIIELSYRSKDPEAAEAVVDAVVHSYLDFMERNHKDVSAELVTILEQERDHVEQRLTEKQQHLLRVKREAGDLGLREGSRIVHPVVQRVVRLNETLVEVQKERMQLQSSLSAIRAAVRSGGDLSQHLVTVEPIVGRELIMSALGLHPRFAEMINNVERKLIDDRAKLKSLSAHWGPSHPEIAQIQQAIQNAEDYLTQYQAKVNQRLADARDGQLAPMLISMVEEKLSETWEHEQELIRTYAEAEAEAVKLNDRMAELQIVEHDLQRWRSLHDTLLNRIANIDINQNQADVRVAVISEPSARNSPVAPKLSLVAALCLLGGLGSGVSIVYVLDLLDDRFRSPEELKQQLGVPVLAMVRKLTSPQETGIESLQVYVAAEAVESEAFRTLRTTLAFSGEELQRLAITSSEPGDGKTTVLSNLAVSFAQAGKKTLLIDADLRRPGLSKLFEMRGLGGLSEVLRSDGEMAAMCEQRVKPTAIDHLHVLPSGPKPIDPTELLSGGRFSDLLAWAETLYDQVLIDCPPVLAAADAAIIGRLSDGMILVVQPDKNHRRMVMRAVEGLQGMQANLVGVVANRIDSDSDGDYYGYGYGYGYGSGYGHDEEDDVPQDELQPKSTDAVSVPSPTAGKTEPRRPKIVSRRAA